jgi:hypothetical protein
MRRACLAGLVLGAWLTVSGSLPAGVYFASHRGEIPPTNPTDVNLLHKGWLGCDDARDKARKAGTQPMPQREQILAIVARLEPRLAEDKLSVLERIDLGACYIRLGRYKNARDCLTQTLNRTPPGEPARFLVLLNLASAWALDRDEAFERKNDGRDKVLYQAIEYQYQALRAWPISWPNWNHEMWLWYRRAEQFQLTYYHVRRVEALGKDRKIDSIDEFADKLFPASKQTAPPFSFAGSFVWYRPGTRRYEPGGLAPEMADRLPSDAQRLVVQMLLWVPQDDWLVWLYAELLNAWGDIDGAEMVMKALGKFGPRSTAELRAHLQAVEEPAAQMREARKQGEKQPESKLPAEGTEPPPAAPAPAPTAPKSWIPDWRPLLVGFGVGFVIALLAGAQWRQWRRKPAVAPSAPVEPATRAQPANATGIRPSV